MKKTARLDLQLRFMAFCERNGIDKTKYFISYADGRCGNMAAIMEHVDGSGSIGFAPGCQFYSFDALNAWMDGYTAAQKLNVFS